jgi:hypothetical protein
VAAAYLDDCAACRPPLDSRYRPTEDGAVKMIPHRRHADREADKTAEDQIPAAFRAAVTWPACRESGTSGTRVGDLNALDGNGAAKSRSRMLSWLS